MIRLPAIKITQPLGDFYICSIPARTLLQIVHIERFRPYIDESRRQEYRVEGIQRRENKTRRKLLSEFIQSYEAVFPNSIILAANDFDEFSAGSDRFSNAVYSDSLETESYRWSIETNDCGYSISIPNERRIAASIVDGQHRLYGFWEIQQRILEISSKSEIDRLERILDTEIPCSVFFDLPPQYQAYVFATINYNQKSVDKSLAYELFAFNLSEDPETWSPDMLSVFLTRRLNSVVDTSIRKHNEKSNLNLNSGPLINRIKIASQVDNYKIELAENNKNWQISTAVVVNGITPLISKRAQIDRYTMYRKEGSVSRKLLQDDLSPLRELYLNFYDEQIYLAISHYFSVVDHYLWNNVSDKSFLKKTVGIQALFGILQHILKEQREQADNSTSEDSEKYDFSLDYFIDKLSGWKNLNFPRIDELNNSSNAGKIEIQNILGYAIQIYQTDSDFTGRGNYPGNVGHVEYAQQFVSDQRKKY